MDTLVDREFLQRYEADDLVRELIALFVEDVPRMIELLRSALHAGAVTTAARSAHTLRGCASNLGARALEELAMQIEEAARAGDANRASMLTGELDALTEQTEAELLEELERRHISGTHDAPLYDTLMR